MTGENRKINLRAFRLLLLPCFLLIVNFAWSGEFSKPTNTVGDANCFGELQFTSHLGSVQLSRSEIYSFYYTYSSDPEMESPHLGKGFFVPMLEAVLIDHDYFLEATTMGGATIYMYRLPADPDRFVSLNGKFRAQKLGDNRYIRETEEGFKFEYRLGKLIKAQTPSGVGLTFEYDGDICGAIRASTGGTVMTFSKRSDSAAVFTSVQGRYPLTLQVHPASRNLPPNQPPYHTLKRIAWPDEATTLFDYAESENGNDIIMTMSYESQSAKYVFNRQTGEVSYADGARYDVTPLRKQVDYEKERRKAGAYSIRRTFEDGNWKRFHHDEDAGYSDSESSNGPTIRTHYINTRGPVFNLVRKREELIPESDKPKLLYEAFYDPEGNLLREVSEGKVTWYLREGGLSKSVVKDGDNVVQFNSKGRVFFSRWHGSTFHTSWFPDGSHRVVSRYPWGEIMLRHYDSNGNGKPMPADEKFAERNSFLK